MIFRIAVEEAVGTTVRDDRAPVGGIVFGLVCFRHL